MKKSFLLILVVLLVATTLFGCSQSSPTSTPVETTIGIPSTNNSTESSEDSIKPSANSNSSSSSEGKFWCMGKNDTCQNKTSDPSDLFCSSCDKNNDDIED